MTDLELLLIVQEHDLALDRLRHRRVHLPARATLSDAEAALAALAPGLAEVRARRDEVARDAKRLDDEVAAVRDRAAEADRTLYSGSVTAVKELQALQADVEHLRARQRELEDRELELMEAQETLDAEVAAAEGASAVEVARAEEARRSLEAGEAEVDAEITTEAEARAAATAGIPETLLATYERIRAMSNGVGVARLVGDTCQGCRLSIPATELDAIRRGVAGEARCDNCGAILVP
ncbi:MAG: zinc ribbon domain-containing protein [Actinomycetes bacterium]